MVSFRVSSSSLAFPFSSPPFVSSRPRDPDELADLDGVGPARELRVHGLERVRVDAVVDRYPVQRVALLHPVGSPPRRLGRRARAAPALTRRLLDGAARLVRGVRRGAARVRGGGEAVALVALDLRLRDFVSMMRRERERFSSAKRDGSPAGSHGELLGSWSASGEEEGRRREGARERGGRRRGRRQRPRSRSGAGGEGGVSRLIVARGRAGEARRRAPRARVDAPPRSSIPRAIARRRETRLAREGARTSRRGALSRGRPPAGGRPRERGTRPRRPEREVAGAADGASDGAPPGAWAKGGEDAHQDGDGDHRASRHDGPQDAAEQRGTLLAVVAVRIARAVHRARALLRRVAVFAVPPGAVAVRLGHGGRRRRGRARGGVRAEV